MTITGIKQHILIVYKQNDWNWVFDIYFKDFKVHQSTGLGIWEQNETEKEALTRGIWKVDSLFRAKVDAVREQLIQKVAENTDFSVDELKSELLNNINQSSKDLALELKVTEFDAKELLAWGRDNWDLPDNYNPHK